MAMSTYMRAAAVLSVLGALMVGAGPAHADVAIRKDVKDMTAQEKKDFVDAVIKLKQATRAYLAAETDIDRERGEVRLPYLMKLYRADFADPVAFAQEHLGEDLAGLRVRYGRYDWQLG